MRNFALALLLTAAHNAQAAPVSVIAQTIERGAIVSEADIAIRDLPEADARLALPGAAIVGKEATRRLDAGRIVRAGDVATPLMVRKGDPVSILFKRGSLAISVQGKALTGGQNGATIRVQSQTSHALMEATVIAPGVVRIAAAASLSTAVAAR